MELTAKQLTYGTGTAIGRHTILTANHVVNDQRAHKPLTPAQPENMRINLLQEGSKVVRSKYLAFKCCNTEMSHWFIHMKTFLNI